ncbi:MAG: TraR/DksA C4-type zinc finger protein [Ferruginibacter sp.]|nr:TraR/DksA family transcriptional regulator [Ferruginibacter sp.]
MATKKPAAKVAAKKPVAKKVVVAKKATPAKKVLAPVKKVAATVKKVAVAKKPVPSKKIIVAKKAAAAPKKPTPTKKVVAKKATPAKKIATPAKKIATPTKKVLPPAKKVASKGVAKKAVKPVVLKKSVTPIIQPKKLSKKIEEKKVVVKVSKVEIKPIAKPDHLKALAKAVADKKVKDKARAIPKPETKKPLVMPKINSTVSRKYEPDFTKSVLDKITVDRGAEIVKYNDADLAEFKELIQRKLGSAKKELAYLQGLLTRKDDMGGDDGDGRYMTMEDGSLSMEREQLSQMASRQITFVDHLEKALIRIENKTYGVCRVTGKLIDKARLRAVPHATLSIEAKMNGGNK